MTNAYRQPVGLARSGSFSKMLFLLLACWICVLAGCSSSTVPPRQVFGSPELATQALVAAIETNDPDQIAQVLGAGAEQIVSSGDPTADRQRYEEFLELYNEQHDLVNESNGTMTLTLGDRRWPFPVPLTQDTGGWVFDPEAGKEEILNRRIGANELSAVEVCKAIADAQYEYAMQDPDADGVHEYAQKFASDPGERNGLYWPSSTSQDPSPLGELAAKASAEGYTRSREGGPAPYHGYFYRILQSQGPAAPGGKLSYVLKGNMTLGYAVLAYPAEYGNSGVMTFLMGSDGVVYQKDLGPNTSTIASEMAGFNPDATWKRAPDSPQVADAELVKGALP